MHIATADGNLRTDAWARWSGEPRPSAERRAEAASKGHLLFIGSALRDAATVSRAARALQFESTWARGGAEGLAAARSSDVDLVFVDLDLPDMPGLDVARTLHDTDPHLRSLLLSSAATISIATRARSVGALGWIEKPLTTNDLIAAVYSARSAPPPAIPNSRGSSDQDHRVWPTALRGMRGSIADRWALMVLQTIDADADPKTVATWGRAIGVSRSVLCECCRLVHVAARDARDFARLIRAICRSADVWQPETVLDLADVRTLKKMLWRGGFADQAVWTPTLEEFLERQQWIAGANPGLMALRRLLYGGGALDLID